MESAAARLMCVALTEQTLFGVFPTPLQFYYHFELKSNPRLWPMTKAFV